MSKTVEIDVQDYHALHDKAHRLAAIERQVIYRTEDMPAWARWWHKGYGWNGNCEFLDEFKETVRTGAPDFRPDEHGPLFMPIIDAPGAGEEEV